MRSVWTSKLSADVLVFTFNIKQRENCIPKNIYYCERSALKLILTRWKLILTPSKLNPLRLDLWEQESRGSLCGGKQLWDKKVQVLLIAVDDASKETGSWWVLKEIKGNYKTSTCHWLLLVMRRDWRSEAVQLGSICIVRCIECLASGEQLESICQYYWAVHHLADD